MHVLLIKYSAALIIWLTALIAGLIPTLSKQYRHSHKLLTYGDFFARGVFLGAGLIHLLPDALDSFNSVYPQIEYPVIFTICVLTLCVIYFIEQGVLHLIYPNQKYTHWLSYLLMVLLSIHSLIAGAALGLADTVAGILIIFIAIISHKGAAAFSLGINMCQSAIPRKVQIKIIVLFSLMTPMGIIFGSTLMQYLQATSGHIFQGIFAAIAAGTFIYIATFDPKHNNTQTYSLLPKISCFGLGVLIMAIVAIWL